MGGVKNETRFQGRSRSFLYQKSSEQSEQNMNKSLVLPESGGEARRLGIHAMVTLL